ncbi:hypothetical protein [Mycobacterium sp. RTGN4]|uniref:hypothetical protein n=1 Tax=Mycobacterium sp. RTGN4 TaxID=3016523 RepID=UPI0029C8B463|nr:hypothetical protein [Mycobacterium sp. RTGN4]
MPQCNETFDRIAGQLGNFTCRDAPAVIHLRNPFGLSNWTLPILELMMVTVAVAALWWAIRRLRRAGDPTNLVLWFGTTVYLLVIEPPLYFPDVFGIEDQVGVVFAHNAFTVQFLFERLPLYIVALYPAVMMLAYEIVRALGVFRDRGIVVGAICVAFVHHCLYEVFDQLGPQLRWWAWNTGNPINHPFLASVPMSSVVIFATIGPLVTVLLAQLLVDRKVQRGKSFGAFSLVGRTLAVGALVPAGVVVLSIPSSVFGGAAPNTTAQGIVYAVELSIVTAIAAPILLRQWRLARSGSPTGVELPNGFVRVFGPLYLGVLAALWVSALPQYFGAVDGVTRDGTPIGNGWYAGASFVLAALAVAAVAMPPKAARPQSVREHHLDRA